MNNTNPSAFKPHPRSRHRLLWVTVLGLASGLPFSLTDSALQAWLASAAVDIKAIGLFSLLSVPYVFKFLWAPALDRYRIPRLGRRRGWMALSQMTLIALIMMLASQNPAQDIVIVACLALAIAFVSATQDIAVDAYRAEILHQRERGLGAGLSVAGYKIGAIISGGGVLMLADSAGFATAYVAVATLLVFGLATSFLADEPAHTPVPAQRIADSLILPLRDLLARRAALALLAFIAVYKLGDAAAGRLSVAFLLSGPEFSLTEVGATYNGIGILASLCGGVFGGVLMLRWGLYRSLLVFGILQAMTNIGFVILASVGKSYGVLLAVVVSENLAGGMGTAALVALLIALCDRRFTATQFALLSGVASIARIATGPPAGYFVDAFGWSAFFWLSLLMAIPGIVLLHALRHTIDALDVDKQDTFNE